MKVAIVEEWLVYGGAARVLEQALECFPDATLFATVDALQADQREHLNDRKVSESLLRFIPGARRKYRWLLALMPFAVQSHNLSGFNVILTLHHAAANGVRSGRNQLHLSYTHTPMRYAWDMRDFYLSGLASGARACLVRSALNQLRNWDLRNSTKVDRYVANSAYVAERIRRCYGREASVIYPPVDVDKFTECGEKADYYLAVSRLVSYKRLDIIAAAFAGMPDKRLIIVGDGPEKAKVTDAAGPNVKLLPYQPEAEIQHLMQKARAFVFAADEDFGIVPVEAQACGTPVIAYARGGVLESVVGADGDQQTGVFFPSQTPQSVRQAVEHFETVRGRISPHTCRTNAMRFSVPRFRTELKEFVDNSWDQYQRFRGEYRIRVDSRSAEQM